ncbi:protein of unknown function [Methylorubrum extorquens DM4]|uniref:Uncharacterized protein n=1 Tax=Methylorubrum extorquens (strain DSM 6343 / CIP 106787 / DM4) TaxID=661410 RepID=C7CFH1_METED|nr:protein of unknown function [Methylorubrum extorquens DM4]
MMGSAVRQDATGLREVLGIRFDRAATPGTPGISLTGTPMLSFEQCSTRLHLGPLRWSERTFAHPRAKVP